MEIPQMQTIVGATIITQICLLMMQFIALYIMKQGTPTYVRTMPTAASLIWLVIANSLITLVLLLFAESYINVWKSAFPKINLPSINSSSSVMWTFILDIICISIVVFKTGGSQKSPFSSIYLILPALAIFLNEPYSHIIGYMTLVSLLFIVTFYFYKEPEQDRANDFAQKASEISYIFVSIACFTLTTFISYITRPT
ncbi:MAG: hypothetical protein HQL10_13430 [Nitrospirae bacterium]|nr:hypothetical protein [Nitrospirota bacterium]